MADSPGGGPPDGTALGVFDSGVGGLTVAAALRRRLAGRRIVYLGDTARLPYGTKSAATVRRYSERNVAFLAERGVSMVVVACNSASALALGGAEGGGPGIAAQVPVVGVVEPGAREAALRARRRLGVVATEATIGSGAYRRAVMAVRPDLEVVAQACPLLVPLVEEGWWEDPVTDQVVERYVAPLREKGIDTLVLGCTHYPLLAPVFERALGPEVTLVDSARAVSEHVAERLGIGPASASPAVGEAPTTEADGPLEIYVTDDSPRFARIARSILGEDVELVWVDTP